MESYLCEFHSVDYGLHGYRNEHPRITCQVCRAGGCFTPGQIEEYERSCYRLVEVFKRGLGYPEKLHVIMDDGDTEAEARRIAPRGSFVLKSFERMDPYISGNDNTIVLEKPCGNQTLENIRKSWDHAPDNCYLSPRLKRREIYSDLRRLTPNHQAPSKGRHETMDGLPLSSFI